VECSVLGLFGLLVDVDSLEDARHHLRDHLKGFLIFLCREDVFALVFGMDEENVSIIDGGIFYRPDTVLALAHGAPEHVLEQHELRFKVELSLVNVKVIRNRNFKGTVIVVEMVSAALIASKVGDCFLIHEHVVDISASCHLFERMSRVV